MSTFTPPAPRPATPSPESTSPLDRWWPDVRGAHPAVLAACAGVGVVGGLILPAHSLGLGWVLAWTAVCLTVLLARRRERWTATDFIDGGLIVALVSTLMVRDAAWITSLCLLAALALTVVNVTRARSILAMYAAAFAVPLASIRGIPWLGRTVMGVRSSRPWLPIVKTAAACVAALIVFGALFASADAVFADWLSAVVPDISFFEVPDHVIVGTFIAIGTLTASYVALSQPKVNELQIPASHSRHRYEWLAPLGVVIAVFAAFMLAQATVLFGGHDYLQRTTGLTYAEYVHRGFAEMTIATVLALSVMAWVHRKAEVSTLRTGMNGALGVLALVLVVSAIYRMSLYMDAYGFTRLRLLVSVFESWLGAVIAVTIVGGALSARWVVPVAVRLGGAGLLGLALMNPDAWIAEHNIERDTSVVAIDYEYLSTLSADAYPAIVDLPDDAYECATAGRAEPETDAWLGWNWGRSQAREAAEQRPDAVNDVDPYASDKCAISGSS